MGILIVSQGRYVFEKGKVDVSSFNAALNNLSEARIARAVPYFKARTDACDTLLRGSARFVDKSGRLNVEKINARLDAITPERVEAIKKRLTKPESALAFDILLRP